MLWNLAIRAGQFVNHKYDIWNFGSWPKIKNFGRFGLKIAMYPIFMKFGTQNKSNMLIMKMLIGIDDLDPKLQICENLVPKRKCVPIFMKFRT